MRLLSALLTVCAVLRLGPCGGETDGGDGPAAPGETGKENPPLGTAPTETGVTVPDLFYETWQFTTVTSYPQGGGEPLTSGLSGFQRFDRNLEYAQEYSVGSSTFNNQYGGTYEVVGKDPKVAGAFLIETTDQDAQKVKWGVALDQGLQRMALTGYREDGSIELIMSSVVQKK